MFSDSLQNLIVNQQYTDLCKIMNRAGSDKGSGWHNYTKFYDHIFNNMRYDNLNILEIGVGTINSTMKSNMCSNIGYIPGASHRGWNEYFKNSTIYGCDIDRNIVTDCDTERNKYFYLDQLDLETIKTQFYEGELKDIKFDIIIDDGLHDFQVNYNVLEVLLPKINKGGYYIIEDIYNYNPDLVKIDTQYKSQYVKLDNPHNNYDNNLFVVHY